MYFMQKICKTETFLSNNVEIQAPNSKWEGNYLERGFMLGENSRLRLILGTYTVDLATLIEFRHPPFKV